MDRGFTLVELLTVMMILALATVICVPRAREALDRLAVQGAREAVVALLARVRSTAVANGGAVVRISAGESRLVLLSGGAETLSLDLGRDYRVGIVLGGGREERDLHFDALGIGRVASQRILFHRGTTEASLVISAYGRVLRR